MCGFPVPLLSGDLRPVLGSCGVCGPSERWRALLGLGVHFLTGSPCCVALWALACRHHVTFRIQDVFWLLPLRVCG